MKNLFDIKVLPWFLLVLSLVYIFLQQSCNDKIIVKKGKEIIKYDTIFKPIELPSKTITKYKTIKGDVVYLPGKVDTVEVKVFEKAEDSTKIKMFTDATKIRQYNQQFKDSLADVSIFAETKGELLKIVPTVTIKARLPEKKTVFAVYGGLELYVPYTFDNVSYKLNLRFQNKKGNLLSGGYDPINKIGFVGYDFRFINIKK